MILYRPLKAHFNKFVICTSHQLLLPNLMPRELISIIIRFLYLRIFRHHLIFLKCFLITKINILIHHDNFLSLLNQVISVNLSD